jgi:hypothetical protein
MERRVRPIRVHRLRRTKPAVPANAGSDNSATLAQQRNAVKDYIQGAADVDRES